MKNMKKCFSILLALVMVFALAATAMAATINVGEGLSGHNFTAYQIFKGTVSDDKLLKDLDWGSGINGEAFLQALKDSQDENLVNKFQTCATAADVVKVLSENNTYNSGFAKAVAKLAYANKNEAGGVAISSTATVDDGYYLIEDTTVFADDATGTAFNTALLDIVGEVDIRAKISVPTVEKKVKDVNDSDNTDATNNVWKDTADHDFKDTVNFQLTAHLAANVSSFDTYKVVFHDTMSKGLSYVGNVKVTIDGKEVTTGYTASTSSIGEDADVADAYKGGTFLTVTFDDVKTLGATDNSTIVVEYEATLNEGAKIGSAGNPNKVYLEYSNNPNNSQGGENDDTGKTTEDEVIVFTYKTVINKVDQNSAPLAGAAFKLEKKTVGEDGAITWTKVYEYTIPTPDPDDPDAEQPATSFEIKGLDDGEYKLSETVVPAGYNGIEPVTFKIVANHDDSSLTLTDLNGTKIEGKIDLKFAKDTENEDALTAAIMNQSGSTLPETGGMGTTILYIAGGVLVAAAAVMLIVKRRMAMEK